MFQGCAPLFIGDGPAKNGAHPGKTSGGVLQPCQPMLAYATAVSATQQSAEGKNVCGGSRA